jgi:hypothetical protein
LLERSHVIKTTVKPIPAVLDLERAIEQFRQDVCPLLDPAQEEGWDGAKLKEKEWAILQAGLRLVGHCLAILIYQLVLTQSVQQAANARALGKAGLNYTNQGIKKVPITLIGNIRVYVPVLYKLARSRRKKRGRKRKRGKSQGQGFYPALTLLGISEGVSPLVRCLVAQAATQSASLEQARPVLSWLGLNFSTRRVRHISRAFCDVGLKMRAEKLAQLQAGTLLAGQRLSGKRVAIAVDGGRTRIRQPRNRGRRRKSGRHGYDAEWKEPKLLIIYVLDEQGRKAHNTEIPLVCDGTLLGKDEFLKILRLYLHELGIACAETIVLLGDGATWIWNNIPDLLTSLGCLPEHINEILDYSHASQHVYALAEAIFGATPKAKLWAKIWSKRLKKGLGQDLLNEAQRHLDKNKCQDIESARKEYAYVKDHQEHGRLDYARFRTNQLPIGSGVIESLIRQVVNLRLKSSGKSWLLETAEGFLHARCQWAAHRWSDFCDALLTFGLVPLLGAT